MEPTLGEQIMHLSLDDVSGAARLRTQSEYMISAATLLELGLAGRICIEDGHVVARDRTPLGVPVLDDALRQIGDQDKPADIQSWTYRLREQALAGARQGLLEQGLIREERTKVWGIFQRTRYPGADGTVEEALRLRLAAAVLEGQEPDDRTAALVVLLHGGGFHRLVFPDADQPQVQRRMAELAQRHWTEPAMRQLTDAMYALFAHFMMT